MNYGHLELFQLLKSNDRHSLIGFEIKDDGIWIDALSEDHEQWMTPQELAVLCEPFTAHDRKKPVLDFPCTDEELKTFLEITGNPDVAGEINFLPTLDDKEVIPLRLLQWITAPPITQELLLEHLHNPIGDHHPRLNAYNVKDPTTVIESNGWKNMYGSDFPAGSFIFRSDFERYRQFKVNGERSYLNFSYVIADDKLKFALDGFELPAEPLTLADAPPPKPRNPNLDNTGKFKPLNKFLKDSIAHYKTTKEATPEWSEYYLFIRGQYDLKERPDYFEDVSSLIKTSDRETVVITFPGQEVKLHNFETQFNNLLK